MEARYKDTDLEFMIIDQILKPRHGAGGVLPCRKKSLLNTQAGYFLHCMV